MELTAAEAWSRILERARAQFPDSMFRIWLSQTEPMALSQDQLLIAAGSSFHADWIGDKYGALLSEVAERVFGRPLEVVIRHVEPPPDARNALNRDAASPSVPAAPAGAIGAPAGAAPAPATPPRNAIGAPLNERYTFDRFVVGANNQLSAAACRAVAEAPARIYNPLFIYGGVGLGKTHLMHAIGHATLARDPSRRVAYISSERFTNDLIASIQAGRMPEFRRRYREIDLLLIDDVQFLGEKERTQEEFFHTFNALYDAQRQIVLTSDRPPKEIPGLEERLVSRFEWGLVTDIKPPDLETRVAILRKKAEEDSLVLADEVLEFIARHCRSSVRELEGAIIKLLAYSSLTRREITVALAREALGGVLRAPDPLEELSAEAIRERVARHWNVSADALTSKRRTKEVTVPRQVAMYLIRELLDLPLVEIGKLFGGRDHSTVIHSIQKVEKEIAADPDFRQRVEALRAELAG
ncbi:MAG TPA: chromosomal replication initiator protein DnaA [Longimicrobiales bacterium]